MPIRPRAHAFTKLYLVSSLYPGGPSGSKDNNQDTDDNNKTNDNNNTYENSDKVQDHGDEHMNRSDTHSPFIWNSESEPDHYDKLKSYIDAKPKPKIDKGKGRLIEISSDSDSEDGYRKQIEQKEVQQAIAESLETAGMEESSRKAEAGNKHFYGKEHKSITDSHSIFNISLTDNKLPGTVNGTVNITGNIDTINAINIYGGSCIINVNQGSGITTQRVTGNVFGTKNNVANMDTTNSSVSEKTKAHDNVVSMKDVETNVSTSNEQNESDNTSNNTSKTVPQNESEAVEQNESEAVTQNTISLKRKAEDDLVNKFIKKYMEDDSNNSDDDDSGNDGGSPMSLDFESSNKSSGNNSPSHNNNSSSNNNLHEMIKYVNEMLIIRILPFVSSLLDLFSEMYM